MGGVSHFQAKNLPKCILVIYGRVPDCRKRKLMYIHSVAFSESLRKSFRAAGHFQQELAEKIGLRPKVLSRKLNGTSNSHLTDKEVRRIIIALIGWKAITTRGEVCYLLALAHLKPDIFSEEEWQRPPLSQLE